MRKQELLQLHGLFGELRRYLAGQDDVEVPADAFAAYDAHGVGPMYVPAGKDAHQTAVLLLVEGVVTAVTDDHDSDPDATAVVDGQTDAGPDAAETETDAAEAAVARPTD